MELKQLITFASAAETLNYSETAKRLHFSQPAISMQIQSLENELGQKLFAHIGRKMYLTKEGEILKLYIDEILTTVKCMQDHFEGLRKEKRSVIIAAHESFCVQIPQIMQSYIQDSETPDIVLRSCFSDEVISGMKENRYDIGIISESEEIAGIRTIKLAEKRVELVVAKTLALQMHPMELMCQLPYIEYRPSTEKYCKSIKKFIDQIGWNPGNRIVFESLLAIKNAILANIGIGVLTEDIIDEYQDENLYILTPPEVSVTTQISLMVTEEKMQDPVIQQLIDTIKKLWK